MRKILLSINPQFVKEIINGTKKYEYRKNIPIDESISSALIYATAPEQKVVGEFSYNHILKYSPQELWNRTGKDAGISKTFFDKYFEKSIIAYAFEIKDVIIYDQAKDLKDIGVIRAPQSWRYVDF